VTTLHRNVVLTIIGAFVVVRAFIGLSGTAVTTRRLVPGPWGALTAVLIAVAWVAASAMAAVSFTDDGPDLPGGIAERIALGARMAALSEGYAQSLLRAS
jgi:hypothetical protein